MTQSPARGGRDRASVTVCKCGWDQAGARARPSPAREQTGLGGRSDEGPLTRSVDEGPARWGSEGVEGGGVRGAESAGPGIPLKRLCYRRQVTKPLWAPLFKDSVDSGSEAYAQHGCGLQWVPHRWSCAVPVSRLRWTRSWAQGWGGERAVWGLPVGLDRLLKISDIPDLVYYMERKMSLKG